MKIIGRDKSEELMTLFKTLLSAYGKRNWWPAKTRFEVIVGAILTQNVSWRNAKIGIQNLKYSGLLSSKVILNAPHFVIAERIKSTRFYNQKTTKLKEFCQYLLDNYDNSLDLFFSNNKSVDELRKELLSIKGIGKETADSIILYAGKKLSFVSDSYTKRWIERYGIFKRLDNYDKIRKYFMENLPRDLYIYNEYHALIVHHGYLKCKSKPDCSNCAIRSIRQNLGCAFVQKK